MKPPGQVATLILPGDTAWDEGSGPAPVPDAPLDPSRLVGVQWQFTIDPTPDGGQPDTCTAELHITNVKFY